MAAENTQVAHEPFDGAAPAPGGSVFARILVPVDFSSCSRAALALALGIAQRWGSDVVLLHAAGFDDNDEFLDHTGVPWGRSDVLDEARSHLLRFADTVVAGSSERVHVEVVRDEDPIRAVVQAYTRYRPSIVVIGAHPIEGRRWWRTRAEKLMRALACHVMLVRGEPEAKMDADS